MVLLLTPGSHRAAAAGAQRAGAAVRWDRPLSRSRPEGEAIAAIVAGHICTSTRVITAFYRGNGRDRAREAASS
jgi:hypothetical protein